MLKIIRFVILAVAGLGILGAALFAFGTIAAHAQEIPQEPEATDELARVSADAEFFYARVNWWSHQPGAEMMARPTEVVTLTSYVSNISSGYGYSVTVDSEGYRVSFGDDLEKVVVDRPDMFDADITYEYYESVSCRLGVTMSVLELDGERTVALRNFSGTFLYYKQVLPDNIGIDGFWHELTPTTNPFYHEVGEYQSGAIIVSRQPTGEAECGRITWQVPPQPEADIRVELTASPNPIRAGQEVNLILTVYNDDDQEAVEISFSVPMPDGPDWSEVVTLGSPAAQQFTTSVELFQDFTFVATVQGDVNDPDETNNTVSVKVDVIYPVYLPVVAK